jgi:hypothetical protein
MPDRRPATLRPTWRRSPAWRARLALWIATTLLLVGAAAALAPVAVAVPGEGTKCESEAAPSGGDQDCPGGGGIGGFDLGLLIPIAGGVLLAGAVALGGAYVVLRRRAAAPLIPEPADAQEWWTCRECGRNNVVGSARCYGCGAWHR